MTTKINKTKVRQRLLTRFEEYVAQTEAAYLRTCANQKTEPEPFGAWARFGSLDEVLVEFFNQYLFDRENQNG